MFMLLLILFSGTSYCTNRNGNSNANSLRTKVIQSFEKIDSINVKHDKSGGRKEKQDLKKEPYGSCCGYTFRDKCDFLRHKKAKKHIQIIKIVRKTEPILKLIRQIFPSQDINNEFLVDIILDPIKRQQLQDFVNKNKNLIH